MRPAVVIVEPSSAGLELIAAVTRLGYQPIVFSYDRDDRVVPAAELRRWQAELVVVDTNDPAAVLDCAMARLAGRPVAGVVPGFEFYVPVAAELAARLGLPGLAPEVSQRVRDKHLMRRALAEAGISQPRFACLSDPSGLPAAAESVGFPSIVKPTRSAGSVHVSLVSGLAEAREAYAAIAFDPTLDLGTRLGAEVLVEEFIAGPEFSVEGFVQDGRTVVVSITEKQLSEPPYFIEVGHTVPAAIDPESEYRIVSWTAEVIRALGIDCTVFHLELRLRNGIPHVIELGARLPGDYIASLIEMSRGVNLADIFVRLATGNPVPAATVEAAAQTVAAIRFFYQPDLDIVSSTPADAELRGFPHVVSAAVTVRPGDRPNCQADFRSRLGWVVMAGADRLSVDQSWTAVRETVRFS